MDTIFTLKTAFNMQVMVTYVKKSQKQLIAIFEWLKHEWKAPTPRLLGLWNPHLVMLLPNATNDSIGGAPLNCTDLSQFPVIAAVLHPHSLTAIDMGMTRSLEECNKFAIKKVYMHIYLHKFPNAKWRRRTRSPHWFFCHIVTIFCLQKNCIRAAPTLYVRYYATQFADIWRSERVQNRARIKRKL